MASCVIRSISTRVKMDPEAPRKLFFKNTLTSCLPGTITVTLQMSAPQRSLETAPHVEKRQARLFPWLSGGDSTTPAFVGDWMSPFLISSAEIVVKCLPEKECSI